MKDQLTIKEFAEFTGIENTTLRYWDDIGLFSPAKRNPDNKYRYYAPEQLIAVNFISVLSRLTIPLKTIADEEEARTPESVTRLIKNQEKLLDMEMRKLRENYSIIHTRLELINYGIRVLEGFQMKDGVRLNNPRPGDGSERVDINSVAVMQRDEKSFILGPRNEWTDGESFYEPFTNFCKRADEMRVNLHFPIGALHDDMDSFMAAPGCPHHFFSMDPTGDRKRPEGRYMIGFHRGYYGDFGDLAERMRDHARKNNLRLNGPVYSMYLLDEVCIRDYSKYLVQASVAVI